MPSSISYPKSSGKRGTAAPRTERFPPKVGQQGTIKYIFFFLNTVQQFSSNTRHKNFVTGTHIDTRRQTFSKSSKIVFRTF